MSVSFLSNAAESPLCHLVVSPCANEHYDSPRSVRLLGSRERKGGEIGAANNLLRSCAEGDAGSPMM